MIPHVSLLMFSSVVLLIQIKRELCSFDILLKLVEMSGKLTCDLDGGGCGQINQIYHTLWCLPHVFTIGITVYIYSCALISYL